MEGLFQPRRGKNISISQSQKKQHSPREMPGSGLGGEATPRGERYHVPLFKTPRLFNHLILTDANWLERHRPGCLLSCLTASRRAPSSWNCKEEVHYMWAGRNISVEDRCYLPIAAAVWLSSLYLWQVGGTALPWPKTPWAAYTHPAKCPQLLHWETKEPLSNRKQAMSFLRETAHLLRTTDTEASGHLQNSNFDKRKETWFCSSCCQSSLTESPELSPWATASNWRWASRPHSDNVTVLTWLSTLPGPHAF